MAWKLRGLVVHNDVMRRALGPPVKCSCVCLVFWEILVLGWESESESLLVYSTIGVVPFLLLFAVGCIS